jgi:DnaK suppressor protein
MSDPTPEELKTAFLLRLRDELDALWSASAQTAADRRPVELDQQSVGRLSRMDAMQQQAMAAAQETRRLGRARALEAAIIGLRRLELEPTVMRCRNCAG